MSPNSANIVVSGGYDKKINMFDSRTKSVTMSVDHEAPVESLMFLPSGSLLISAGNIKIYFYLYIFLFSIYTTQQSCVKLIL